MKPGDSRAARLEKRALPKNKGHSRDFSDRIVRWQQQSGRNDLPWQLVADPYRIWISEIMLQQTQVKTVIPRYEDFMRRFPDLETLANADADEVMRCWSGLGYYARARNLHQTARYLLQDAAGELPGSPEQLQALPGIGRSTAAAIAVFAFGRRAAILDANVKRVLARHFGVPPGLGASIHQKHLWMLAEEILPHENVDRYSQGLMDLGATICNPRTPLCGQCPLSATCSFLAAGNPATTPANITRPAKPQRNIVMLVIHHRRAVMLEQRPARGIWGALWSLPEAQGTVENARELSRKLGIEEPLLSPLPQVIHGLTHLTMVIQPVLVGVKKRHAHPAGNRRAWVPLSEVADWALPAPVRKILTQAFREGQPLTDSILGDDAS